MADDLREHCQAVRTEAHRVALLTQEGSTSRAMWVGVVFGCDLVLAGLMPGDTPPGWNRGAPLNALASPAQTKQRQGCVL